MDLQQRINLLIKLGEYIVQDNEEWKAIKDRAYYKNPWFIPEFINTSAQNISKNFLALGKLQQWINQYSLPTEQVSPKTVGIVMAGNIPLVGFHDFLCAFISGHRQIIKTSSKDEILIKHLVEKIHTWATDAQNYLSFADQLKECGAYIATGSNNTGRYFEYYFSKYPHIIRKNRTSVAILRGEETNEDLNKLARDIQLYFGLGCRSITKLYVPENYDFKPLLKALDRYEYFMEFHKYKHNYDYQLALLIMNNKYYMTNGCVLLTENNSLFSPVSQINYEYYSDIDNVIPHLKNNSDIQCIAEEKNLLFGITQSPELTDYADNIDTMKFLLSL